jgi:hypothetical protein
MTLRAIGPAASGRRVFDNRTKGPATSVTRPQRLLIVRAEHDCYNYRTAQVCEERVMRDLSRRWVLANISVALAFVPRGILLAAEAAPVAEKRLALSGYDPVSYFTPGHPEKGSADYTAAYDDTSYWFRSAEHRALFVADPDHYAPQFAGYCAVMMSRGEKYEADPEAWAIAEGKLWVFGSKAGVPLFQQHTASIIEKATANWPELRKQR